MSNHSTACPNCKAALRSARPFPPGKQLRCPRCAAQFFAGKPAPQPELSASMPEPQELVGLLPRDRGPMIALAFVSALLLLGAGIGGTMFFLRSKADPLPPVDNRAEEERKKLEEDYKRLKDRVAAEEADRKRKQEEEEQERKRKEREKQEEEKKGKFVDLLKKGHEALDGKNYKDAIAAFSDALKLYPEDADAKIGLQRAQIADTTASSAEDDQKRIRDGYNRLMAEGMKAKEDKNYKAALDAFEGALQVLPNDADAIKARKEVADILGFQFFMDQGNLAMVKQDYQGAFNLFTQALALSPGNPDGVKAMKAAQARLDAIADKAKKAAEAQALVAKGRAARAMQQFDSAIDSFTEALKLNADDRDAQQGLAEATKTRDALKAEFNLKMAQGQQALQAKQYADARALFLAAANIFPDSAEAQKGVRLAQQGIDAAAAVVAPPVVGPITPVVPLTALQTYLAQGQLAMTERRWNDAYVAFTAALQISPNDPNALAGLLALQKVADFKTARRIQILNLLNTATQAMQTRQYPNAIQAYKDVLKLDPDNLPATNGLADARYQRYFADGQSALIARHYQDAVLLFEYALAQKPGDYQATAQLAIAKQKLTATGKRP